jgi:site-specific DNA-methyltransferase (adenine-specific)
MKHAAEISPLHREDDAASSFVLRDSSSVVTSAPQLQPPPPYEVHRGDAVEWLRTLPNACVDLVITDPPYESLEKHRAIGTTTRLKRSKASSNDWFSIFPNGRFEELFTEIWRILKRNSHFYLFCDAETMFVAKPIGEKVGFKFWKPIVWDKKKIGMGYHYRSRYEFILFFEKGKRKLSNLGTPDVLEVPRIINGYPTEKPVELSRVLIEQSSVIGEHVVDPFMGTASVGTAAVALGRTFWGNDISDKSLEIARERLIAAQFRLPTNVSSVLTKNGKTTTGKPARKVIIKKG